MNDSESPQPIENIDEAIAEFHRAARKKKAMVFGVAAVFAIAIGILVLVIGVTVEAPATRYEVKTLFLGGALVVAGLGAALSAYRLATGEVDDAELGPTPGRYR
jgi:hypothetical protein